ncbi:hypothetical protein GJ744_000525 [Endocarpon pusillum]|uniref:Tat pathway signal sequence n=1 Tax=Endocarpon pusillum TaxID=364733 RepID=A0A8H7E3W2_9EURO|nr:hypothetical protein GJ744_000525 [Endocarpon pusillum]
MKMFGDWYRKEYKAGHNSQGEQSETLLSDTESSDSRQKPQRSTISRCGRTVLFLASLCVAAGLGAWFGSRWHIGADHFCAAYASQYSPIRKDVDITYNVIRFNGSLLKENVYRQDAGPDVDAAWASLGVDYRSVMIPADEAAKSGLLADQVKIADKYGGGFPANVEGLHQLHCLNLLRKSLYYNFDHYHALGEGAFSNSDHILRHHVSHCLDIIRQQLMCTIDTGVLGQVWWNRNWPEAYVDFNTQHKCKNFDAIRQWAEDHQLPKDIPFDFLQPPQEGDTIYEHIP